MNFSVVLSLAGALLVVALGAAMLTPLFVFVDLVSVLIVVFGTIFILIATYGGRDLNTYGVGAVRRWLMPAGTAAWSPAQHAKAVRLANGGGYLAMLVGAVGTLIGCVQMLQNLDDPRQIGPALAVAILTLLYAVAMNVFLFVPLARHHRVRSGPVGGGLDQDVIVDTPLTGNLVVLALIGMGVGLTFFVMLLAMGTSV